MTTTTTTTTNPGWRIQLAVHRAVRRDITRLSAALAGGGEVPVEAVRAYWSVTAAQLHHHHELEDTVISPLMSERLGDRVETLLTRNSQQHDVMAATMDEFDSALAASDIAPAGAALARMQQAIEAHLAAEEADLLPLIPDAFTPDDLAYCQAESTKTNTASAFLPWMLDDAPDEDLAFFTATMPAPVVAQLDADWMPKRRTAIEALHLTGSVVVAGS
jgi:hemerythrin-like domain-containing protein